MNAFNINFSLLPTKFLQPVNLAISTVHSLISLQPRHSTCSLSVVTLSCPPSPHWKSLITHSDMHHLAFGINFQIHFVSLVSPVSIHLLHFLTHLCHHRHSHHPLLLHSFTQSFKPTFTTNPSHLNFSSLLTGLPSWSWDLSHSSVYFLKVFFFCFLFVPCGRLSWLSISFLLHVSYHMVSLCNRLHFTGGNLTLHITQRNAEQKEK